VTNDLGELLAFKITRGSRSDSQETVHMLKGFKFLAFGDKCYLGKKIFEELINRKRKNMQEIASLSIKDIADFNDKLLDEINLKRNMTKDEKQRAVYLSNKKISDTLQNYLDNLKEK
jgi:hypothetical protein